MTWNNPNLVKVLKDGGVVVMPTDTIYGLLGSALDVSVFNRISNLKKRVPEKPFIVLVGDIKELKKFSIFLSEEQKEELAMYWSQSDPVSIVLDCLDETFAYLHRGTKTLAFRVPVDKDLRKLLKEVGPLVAPSANPAGLLSAKSIEEAKKYFNDEVDMYIDGGVVEGSPSRVIKLHQDGSITMVRE